MIFPLIIERIIKEKYLNKNGSYLCVNNINNNYYVGKSVNIFNRLNKNYLSNSYIFKNKEKWLFVQLFINTV